MKFVIDTATKSVELEGGRTLDLYGKEAFELISDIWLKMSWNQKYSYTFHGWAARSFSIRTT